MYELSDGNFILLFAVHLTGFFSFLSLPKLPVFRVMTDYVRKSV
jgi:hypothetical protein